MSSDPSCLALEEHFAAGEINTPSIGATSMNMAVENISVTASFMTTSAAEQEIGLDNTRTNEDNPT